LSPTRPTADDINSFWFDEAGPSCWYKVSPAFDARVRRRFAKTVEEEAAACRRGRHPWLDAPDSALALVLLFDQFPRNIWRGSGKGYTFDPLALSVARAMIATGFDHALPEDRRAFVYMPFMHSEDPADQALCVEYAADRLEETSTLRHARLHRDVIERFGRFPHRNEALGRECTPDEAAFLDGGGYAPGRKRPAKST
jgi:uncharacterized protein (DUF924 family)